MTQLQAFAMQEPARTLRVMTFNIRHGKGMDGRVRLKRIFKEIQEGNPDIVALQEVDRYSVRSGFRDQIRLLAKLLGMQACFAPSLRFGCSQYGNAFMSRYPITAKRVAFLPGMERRSLLHIRVNVNGRPLALFNTHLGLSPFERQRQMRLLERHMEEVEEPAVLMGDFNLTAGHPILQSLYRTWHKIHLLTENGTFKNGAEIDHIFIRASKHQGPHPLTPILTRLRAWTQATNASDHLPVLADIPIAVLQ